MGSDRRRLVARHALAVLAEHGARGLTHRAVDQAAGLPPGSTSYYHRTRAALLDACVDDLVRQDEAEIAAMAPLLQAADEEQLAGVLADVLHRWATTDRTRHLGRYELFLESRRHPDLAESLHRGGLAVREAVAHVLAGLGAPEPHRRATWLVAAIEGALFERIAGYLSSVPVDRDELLDLARWLVRSALA
ncbi:transcriptional regulator, TetR family [Cellulomonas flavigena DSM 20109]|uniref:Transcriptional regulator, TetR family n=1 Tax=Cellulomonas flavigena (strain ATCC 482 / DSM 20109 / BCRC 11376 / JCM 18109 / NBRC 3775 / NCIMB 8073 / NRS 134) TaxID=446466 RepID=D5UH24_CELFN|nr:TetR/AcrR family transcriptional regulator [Cellulomonas flavigena]ADG73227.1 transcriptional regulator, TetR family [Cellulomonas flavigena DSM 20109]